MLKGRKLLKDGMSFILATGVLEHNKESLNNTEANEWRDTTEDSVDEQGNATKRQTH